MSGAGAPQPAENPAEPRRTALIAAITMAAALEQPKKPTGGAPGRFMAEKRSEFMEQCKRKPVSEVSNIGCEAWKTLTEAERAPYQKQFEEAKKKV